MNLTPRVWLAENDEELREMVAFVLRKSGLEVVELANGRQILEWSADHPLPDLLVTDHHMPDLNGLEAVEQLRDRGATIPVVLVTAFAESSVRARAERLGVLLVEKPCDVYALRQAILDQLNRSTPP